MSEQRETTSSSKGKVPAYMDLEEKTNGTSKHDREERTVEKVVVASGGHAPTPTETVSGVQNLVTITGRELRSYFDSLTAYIVLGGSMLAVGIWFFLIDNAFWEVGRATCIRMFEGYLSLPVLSIFVIPLLTMRALAEEKRSGTLELLITMPVRDSEVILGKYFGALAMYTLLLLATLLYPVVIFKVWHLGALDWGPIASSYLGMFLYGAAGIALGIMFSSLTESQIIAFFITAGTLAILYVIGGVSIVETMRGWAGDSIAFISFQSRFAPFARGVIDTRAVVFFLSVAVMSLLVAFRSLESRKWS